MGLGVGMSGLRHSGVFVFARVSIWGVRAQILNPQTLYSHPLYSRIAGLGLAEVTLQGSGFRGFGGSGLENQAER